MKFGADPRFSFLRVFRNAFCRPCPLPLCWQKRWKGRERERVKETKEASFLPGDEKKQKNLEGGIIFIFLRSEGGSHRTREDYTDEKTMNESRVHIVYNIGVVVT